MKLFVIDSHDSEVLTEYSLVKARSVEKDVISEILGSDRLRVLTARTDFLNIGRKTFTIVHDRHGYARSFKDFWLFKKAKLILPSKFVIGTELTTERKLCAFPESETKPSADLFQQIRREEIAPIIDRGEAMVPTITDGHLTLWRLYVQDIPF